MDHKLDQIIEAFDNIDQRLSPVELGNARERLLVGGLHALAAEFDKEIAFTRIDTRGDMLFNIKTCESDGRMEYGSGLSDILSTVPHRTGDRHTKSRLLPENNWCLLSHFNVEVLLRNAAKIIYAPQEDSVSAPGM